MAMRPVMPISLVKFVCPHGYIGHFSVFACLFMITPGECRGGCGHNQSVLEGKGEVASRGGGSLVVGARGIASR